MFDWKSGGVRTPAAGCGARDGAGERAADLADGARREPVGALDVGLGLQVGVDEDRDGVLEVIEDDERVGEHQRHVGQPEGIAARPAGGSPSGSTVRTRS